MTPLRAQQIQQLQHSCKQSHWNGTTPTIVREMPSNLHGSLVSASTLAQRGAKRLWHLIAGKALQSAKAGAETIYLFDWQIAADANLAGAMYTG